MTKMAIAWAEYISGKRSGIGSAFVRMLLYPLGKLYAVVATARNICYDRGLFAVKKVGVPVVSIGNLVVGGTGKTPVTLMVAKALKEYGVAVISRGYRSHAEKGSTPKVLSYGEGPRYSVKQCGDEPYLLAKNLDDALVIVGKDRYRAATMAAKAGVGVVVLDDGMQHRRLARDVDIVVIDGNDPLGQGQCVPRGFLREPLWGFERADVVIANNVADESHYNDVVKKVRRYTDAPVVAMRPQAAGIYDLDGERVEDMRGKKVGIFSGIAKPENFRRQVERLGAIVAAEYIVGDHNALDDKDFARFAEECRYKGCERLLCTEKDSVKMSKALASPLPVAWMRIQLEVIAGAEQWRYVIEDIGKKIRREK